ncbi:MAG: GspE family protein [Polaromonas sp.]|nr:GspE family protein [Polaromonas sp.]
MQCRNQRASLCGCAERQLPVDQLGLGAELVEQLGNMVHRSCGLILVCGPTGSGKTTTLHSLLEEVNTPKNKIWTAEDPIEITHPGLRHIQKAWSGCWTWNWIRSAFQTP